MRPMRQPRSPRPSASFAPLLVALAALTQRGRFAPALATVIDDAALAKLDEPLRPLYAPLDGQPGKHALQVDGIDNHPAVAGLKANRDKALGDFARTRDALARFQNVDPEKYAALVKAEEERATADAEKKGQFDVLKQQLIEKHTGELTAERGRAKKYESALDKALRQDAARAALTDAEVKGNADLLLPHFLPQTAVVEAEDGTFVVRVVDAKGNPRIKDASGAPMTLKDLALEMRGNATFASAFGGTGMSGSGAHGGTNGSGGTSSSALRGEALRKSSPAVKAALVTDLTKKHAGDSTKAIAEYQALLTA